MPPVAATAFEYAVPCVPEGRLGVVMVKAVGVTGAAAIDRVTVAVVVVLPDLRFIRLYKLMQSLQIPHKPAFTAITWVRIPSGTPINP